ncbi:unnamed protein product, partial [Prorocentrum cordatum]
EALCAHAPARFQRRPQPQPPTEGSGRASLRREALAASVATPLRKRHSEPTAAEEALLRQITPVKLAKAEAKRPRHLARLASCPACISREDSRAGWRVSPREIFHSPPEIPGALPRSRCGLTLRPALPPRADEFAPSPPRPLCFLVRDSFVSSFSSFSSSVGLQTSSFYIPRRGARARRRGVHAWS